MEDAHAAPDVRADVYLSQGVAVSYPVYRVWIPAPVIRCVTPFGW